MGGGIIGSMCDDFQSDDRSDQCRQEKEPPERRGFTEKEDADDDGSDRTDSRPYGIGRTDGKRPCRTDQQHHADREKDEKACTPQRRRRAVGLPHLAQTKGKGRFETSGKDQHQPVQCAAGALSGISSNCCRYSPTIRAAQATSSTQGRLR